MVDLFFDVVAACADAVHLTLFFDVPVAVGQARLKAAQSAPDRFEQSGVAFYERVRAVYLERARKFPGRFRVIDATLSLEEVKEALDIIVSSQ